MKTWGGMFLCALTCLLSTAAMAGVVSAQASPRFETHERSLRLSMQIEASNGYRGWIKTEGHKRVTLTLEKGGTTLEARTSGKVTRHGIEARFGDMGRILVRFRGRPSSLGERDGERKCRGRRSRFEDGLFSGTVRFRGENDFTRVSLKSAGGFLERHYRRACRVDRKKDAFVAALEQLLSSLRLTILRAGTGANSTSSTFEAIAVDFRPLFGPDAGFSYLFSTQTVEHVDGMRLTRSIQAEGNDGSFLYSRKRGAPRSATVTPPKPFTGTADYRKRAGSPSSWTGSLAAHLPGAGLVPMTGPMFKAAICDLTFADLLEGRCLSGPAPMQLQSRSNLRRALAQGSGSQSQAFWDDRLSWSR